MFYRGCESLKSECGRDPPEPGAPIEFEVYRLLAKSTKKSGDVVTVNRLSCYCMRNYKERMLYRILWPAIRIPLTLEGFRLNESWSSYDIDSVVRFL